MNKNSKGTKELLLNDFSKERPNKLRFPFHKKPAHLTERNISALGTKQT
jgi:hypothetical protein